ncbi:hypothetical protein QUF80_24035 [Desulfococcaceae bacterium HSG8]|nr:hypothetical protein [Desulfococcaceae bacterium HSG8]
MTDHIDGTRLVVCIDNGGNEASLEKWKIYYKHCPITRRRDTTRFV